MTSVELDALRVLRGKVEGLALPSLKGAAAAVTSKMSTAVAMATIGVKPHELTRSDVLHAASIEQAKASTGTARVSAMGSSTKATASLDGLSLTALGPPSAVGKDAPLAACASLRIVTVRGNPHLSSVDLQGHVLDALPELREFVLDSNPSLTTLSSSSSALTHLKLESLSLSGNGLKTPIPDLQFQKLTSLDLSGNGAFFATFPSNARLPLLTSLDIARNGFTSLESVSSLIHLSTLNASCNKLTSLVGVESMTKLEKLDASGNRLGFNRSMTLANPLRGCSGTLTSLDVSNNEINTLAFFVSMPKLWSLDMSGNAFGNGEQSTNGPTQTRRPGSASGRAVAPSDDIGGATYDDPDEADAQSVVSKVTKAASTKAGSVRTKATTAKTTGTALTTANAASAQGPFLTRLAALCPNLEILDLRQCPGAVAHHNELAALAKMSRLNDLKMDVGVASRIVAEVNEGKRAARAVARQNRRQARLLKKAAQAASATAVSYQDRMSRAFDFGAPAAPAPAPAADSSSSSDEEHAPNEDDEDEDALAEALTSELAKHVPTLEWFNDETFKAAPPRLGSDQRPMTARSAAERVLAEEEILASVLDADTMAALRDIGFDANRAVASNATLGSSNTSGRPTSARRPMSARDGNPKPLPGRDAKASNYVDPLALRRDLDAFVDQVQASKEYALEALERIDHRLQWAYGNADELTAAPLYPPMHPLWSETSQARRSAMEEQLAAQREARLEAQRAKALALLASDSKNAVAALVSSPAPSQTVATARATTPQVPPARTPTKPTGRSQSSPRPISSSSSSVVVSVAALDERPQSNDASKRGGPRRSHSTGTATTAQQQAHRAEGRSSSASTRTATAVVLDKAGASRSLAPAGSTTSTSRSKSFAEEQQAFKRQMEREAEARRHAALAQLPATPPTGLGGSLKGPPLAAANGVTTSNTTKKKVTSESGTSMDDRPTSSSSRVALLSSGAATAASQHQSVGTGPMSPPRPEPVEDPLAKYRLRPVDAPPTATAASTSTVPVTTSAVVARSQPAQQEPARGVSSDDDSSIGEVSDEKDDDDGAPSPVKGVVVSHDPRARVRKQEATTPVDLLRPSSANVNTRHQGRPSSSGGGSGVFVAVPGAGTAPTPFVSTSIKQSSMTGKLTVTTSKPSVNTASSITPGTRSALLVPVSGNGVTASIPDFKNDVNTPDGSRPTTSASTTAAEDAERAKAAVAASLQRIESGDVYRTQPKPVLTKAGSLNRRR